MASFLQLFDQLTSCKLNSAYKVVGEQGFSVPISDLVVEWCHFVSEEASLWIRGRLELGREDIEREREATKKGI